MLTIDEIARPPQMREVGEILRRHADDGTRPGGDDQPRTSVIRNRSGVMSMIVRVESGPS